MPAWQTGARWILVPIVAFASTWPAGYAVAVVSANTGAYDDGGLQSWIVRVLLAGVVPGMAFVLSGALVAPRHRRQTAVALALLLMALLSLVWGVLAAPPPDSSPIERAFFMVFGGLVGARHFWHEDTPGPAQ